MTKSLGMPVSTIYTAWQLMTLILDQWCRAMYGDTDAEYLHWHSLCVNLAYRGLLMCTYSPLALWQTNTYYVYHPDSAGSGKLPDTVEA